MKRRKGRGWGSWQQIYFSGSYIKKEPESCHERLDGLIHPGNCLNFRQEDSEPAKKKF